MSISDPDQTSPQQASWPRQWPDYRAVWRWHFYAGLLTLPFVVILSISGAIYLFKPQIEAWNERQYDNLEITTAASVTDQVRAALAAFPDSIPTGYELPQTARSASRVIVRQNGEAIRVYVHPQTLAVLHSVPENDRFMRWVSRLHGELLMGDWGSHLVELAASWTIIMLVTGLYLWWPRQSSTWGGIAYPRLRLGSRIFWKDIHSVTGVWISSLALFLLLSGLPWAKFWGEYFKTVRRMTGTAVAQQDWTTGSERSAAAQKSAGGEHSGHGGSSRRGEATMPKDLTAFDRVVATVRPLGLDHPVVVAPPARGSEDWSAKSTTPNRPRRVDLKINGTTGTIISREDFSDRHLIDRIVSTGVAAHEGQLFGWPNQLLGLATAMGLVLLSVSGVIMWWRRRDQGVLGAPRVVLSPRLSLGLLTLLVLLGIYLPLFGASLLLVLLLEWGILRRIPSASRWLGLTAPALLVILMATLTGCGPQPVAGGTTGTLRVGGELLSDFQVTIHQVTGTATDPIGFGVTNSDGAFLLLTNGAQGPLWLSPGEYSCTLESAGAPLVIPQQYTQATTTPLKVTWGTGSESLDLAVPAFKLMR